METKQLQSKNMNNLKFLFLNLPLNTVEDNTSLFVVLEEMYSSENDTEKF